MVGNFREVFIFAFFASQESFTKIKTVKILVPMCKANELRFNPGLLLYSSLQKHVSECAFDGYHWSNPKCYVNTDAQSRQRHKAESGSNSHGPQIHWLRKLKPRTFLKSEFWPISRKFVPAKITNHTVYLSENKRNLSPQCLPSCNSMSAGLANARMDSQTLNSSLVATMTLLVSQNDLRSNFRVPYCFQKFPGGVCPQTPLVLHGMLMHMEWNSWHCPCKKSV